LNSEGSAYSDTVEEARRSIATCRETMAEADPIIGNAELSPVPLRISHRDLFEAEQAVAASERRIERQAQVVEQLRSEGLSTERSEAIELEMKKALWHQRGLAFEIRKLLGPASVAGFQARQSPWMKWNCSS
jgi:hypothetical protein